MTDGTGTVRGEPSSPFPAAYGPVGGNAGGEPDDTDAPRSRARTRAGARRPRPALFDQSAGAPTGTVRVVPPPAPAGAVPRPARVDAKGRPEATRRLVRRVDTWTVLKVSLVFYLLLLVIVLVAGIVVWNVAVGLGFIADIDKAVRSLADDQKFTLHPRNVLAYTSLVGAILAAIGTFFNVIAALLYNLISDVVGGVQVVVVTGE